MPLGEEKKGEGRWSQRRERERGENDPPLLRAKEVRDALAGVSRGKAHFCYRA